MCGHSKGYGAAKEEGGSEECFTAGEVLEWMEEEDRQTMSKARIAKALGEMAKDETWEFVKLKDMNHEGDLLYSLDTWAMVRKLKLNLLDATVEDTFPAYHGRVFRVLRHNGYLEEKKLSGISLVKIKETRGILSDLFQQGFIHMQEITQSKGGLVLAYHVDEERALEKVKQKVLKVSQACESSLC